jgi:hypothetical protein
MRGAVAMMARNKKQSHAGFLFGWFKACDQ